jgi:carbon-monoxide dehydrogenase large subunit
MADQSPVSFFDRPNSYVGRSVTRPNARRLLAGRGRYVDDMKLPHMLHSAFVRSPYAHAKILDIDISEAKAVPGVISIITADDLTDICKSYVGVLVHLEGLKSAPQHPLAKERATWQGEPVVAIAAASRAIAEDAANLVMVDWEELPTVANMETALNPDTPVIHPELGDNLAWHKEIVSGDTTEAFKEAVHVVEETFKFGRHTGVTLEPRSMLADYDPVEERLTVHHSGQGPHFFQALWASILDIPETSIRVVSPDVGGSFGIKIHTYGDEIATLALSKMLGRPVKFVADRLESFSSDIHARDHRVKAKMGLDAEGKIIAFEIDDLTGIGPYSMYPRSSAIELNQVINLTGGQYVIPNYKAIGNVVLQNKNMMCQYRAVGHPIATTVAEATAELAAAKAGLDPVEFRRRNLVADDAYPTNTPSGLPLDNLSHQACLEKLLKLMDYDEKRVKQAELRHKGVYRGIGLASFIEVTNPSPMFYGIGGAKISAMDGCTLRVEPSGKITCAIGVTEQGQGTDTIIAQVVATAVGVRMEDVRVLTGDTDTSAYGGGTWGSRGAGIGGEAAFQSGKALKHNILTVAASVLQTEADTLDLIDGVIVDKGTEVDRMGLEELATMVQFRTHEIPNDVQPEFVVTRHFRVKGTPFVLTNGIQGAHIQVDIDTGFIKLLKHFIVEDCGTVINPQLVDEQIRGGVVQGIGGALLEHCQYSDDGQLLNCTMADYLVPMAFEMPDIVIGHIETPTSTSELGAKGAGEAGTGGAPAAILNAVNDALKPFDARVTDQPITPEIVLRALGKV